MDRKKSFVEQLNNQLNQYKIERIILAEQRQQRNFPKIKQNKAKQSLIDLGDVNQSSIFQENTTEISRWNNKHNTDSFQQNPIITKRNNFITERYNNFQNRMDSLRSFSTKQIPHLKGLLEKLSTPTNEKKKNVGERGALTSARCGKNVFQYQERILAQKHQNVGEQAIQTKGFISERKVSLKRQKIIQRKDSENKNPILYSNNQTMKQKRRLKQYQKINRKVPNHWSSVNNESNTNANDTIYNKKLLQNLSKNSTSKKGVSKNISQAALSFLSQYSNLNYFSSNFMNEYKKKDTLTNLLI